MKTPSFLWLVCLALAELRLTLPSRGLNPADSFKDVSHLFVGGLFGAAIASKRKDLWIMAIGLTLLELVAFLAHG